MTEVYEPSISHREISPLEQRDQKSCRGVEKRAKKLTSLVDGLDTSLRDASIKLLELKRWITVHREYMSKQIESGESPIKKSPSTSSLENTPTNTPETSSTTSSTDEQ